LQSPVCLVYRALHLEQEITMEHPDYWRRPELDTIDDLEREVADLLVELQRSREGDQSTVPVPHAPGWAKWPAQALCYEDLIALVDVMAIHEALARMDLEPYEQE
jgi:hypothetical protein